jgi:hypothetical protein
VKKALLILLIGILVIVLVCVHVIGFSHISFSQSKQDTIMASYRQYDENIYTAKEDMDNKNLAELAPFVDEFLELLPQDTKRDFEDGNWKIIISTQKPIYVQDAEYHIDYNIGGNTNDDFHIIYVYLNDILPEYLLSDFIHEFGHFEDWENGSVAKSSKFKKLFEENKNYTPGDTFNGTDYHKSSSVEFFACCYKDYFLYREQLMVKAPAVYNYIDDIIRSGNSDFIAFYLRVFNI